MISKRRIVIVGATSSIAEHCARLWIEAQPCHLVLIGRDYARTERIAADLRVRSPQSTVEVVTSGFMLPSEIDATVAAAWGDGVDLAFIAHGMLPDQAACEQDLAACHAALEVNALSPVLFAESFAKRMAKRDQGILAVIGSVAGDRGRKSNYVYGAAKGLVERYLQGLRHRFANSGVKIAIIKPGPTETPMTAHLKGSTKLAPVDAVARDIVISLAKGREVIYAPGKWQIIMLVIRHLPGFVFNKLNI